MAMGYYPTVEDMVKIALLYDNGGKFDDLQILSSKMLADTLPGQVPGGGYRPATRWWAATTTRHLADAV